MAKKLLAGAGAGAFGSETGSTGAGATKAEAPLTAGVEVVLELVVSIATSGLVIVWNKVRLGISEQVKNLRAS